MKEKLNDLIKFSFLNYIYLKYFKINLIIVLVKLVKVFYFLTDDFKKLAKNGDFFKLLTIKLIKI